jgi:hypothetical protein
VPVGNVEVYFGELFGRCVRCRLRFRRQPNTSNAEIAPTPSVDTASPLLQLSTEKITVAPNSPLGRGTAMNRALARNIGTSWPLTVARHPGK